jgi:hypothetical protein
MPIPSDVIRVASGDRIAAGKDPLEAALVSYLNELEKEGEYSSTVCLNKKSRVEI